MINIEKIINLQALIATIIVSYLIGSIPFAIIITKLMNLQDPRTYGSNNPGATNVLRSGKKLAALLTLLGDTFKGWIVVYLAINLKLTDLIICSCALFVIIGHMYSIFLKFKGGKGVATAIGVLFALSLSVAIITVISWILIFIITKLSSLSSILSAIIACIISYIIYIYNMNPSNYVFFYTILIISVLIIYRHKDNIINLIKGEENKLLMEEKKHD